jgi:DNA-3-methyladenine glycosylase I
MLCLEGAQAGLSWYTVLKRREFYRQVFKNFDPYLVAAMTDNELELLLNNPNIIRNRLKIFATRQNAKVFLNIQEKFGSFDQYIWEFVDNKTIVKKPQKLKDIATSSKESDALSYDLKKRGMSFIGSTIIYAHMQATGLVNDHMECCFKSN